MPNAATGLIIGGRVVPCARPVFNWHDHGMEFRPGDGARRRMKKQVIDLFVWHWTGGEGSAKALYRVLDTRELGVEFAIEEDGEIFQYADPLLVDTYDAGPYNPRSMGCEVVNYGFMGKGRPPRDPNRTLYTTIQNGRKREFAAFYQPQLEAAWALACAVSDAVPSIPRRVPAAASGLLYPDTMTRRQLAAFAGHLGHYHLTNNKSDPGADLLGSFLTRGFVGTPV